LKFPLDISHDGSPHDTSPVLIQINIYCVLSDFHGLEQAIFLKALNTLENKRKAEIIGEDGVKFF
jgi:hypothetical protein